MATAERLQTIRELAADVEHPKCPACKERHPIRFLWRGQWRGWHEVGGTDFGSMRYGVAR